jgi:tetratricopeptide (TPR) repeat protein
VLGRPREGLEDCEASLRLKAGDAFTLDSRGLCYLKLRELDLAIDDFTAALTANPKIANALYGRGLAKRKKGDESGAESDLVAARAVYADIAKEFWHYGID